jgi:hypothetical protein
MVGIFTPTESGHRIEQGCEGDGQSNDVTRTKREGPSRSADRLFTGRTSRHDRIGIAIDCE